MTLHSPQVHGFFDVPTDVLTARPVLKAYFAGRDLSQTLVVAPDGGRMSAAARFADSLGLPVASGSKTRISDTEVRVTGLGGGVAGSRRAIIYDDEISSGASAQAMTKVLIEHGIEEVTVVCTHGVLVGGALERLTALPQVTGIVTTDTVPVPEHKRVPKLQVLTVAPLFGEAIRHNYFRRSIGDLYTYGKDTQMED
jgi:ribose-phosphate pyrophosphokinase